MFALFLPRLLYCELVGSLHYLTLIHPNISFVVIVVAQYTSFLHASHMNAAKEILCYIKDTMDFNISTTPQVFFSFMV